MRASARLLAPAVLALIIPAVAFAQDPPPPPPPAWTGSIGAGLAVTSGNSDTSNINLSFKTVYDPKATLVFSAEGLYIRGSNDGELNADNAAFGVKLDRRLSDRAYAFVKVQYLRDSFKAIDYFVAPTAGLGYKLVDSDRAKLSTDVSVGPSWEKNPDQDVRTNLAISFGEKASYVLSKTATFTQGFGMTVVGDDWADGLYTFTVGLAASVTGRTQLKFEVVDVYKNKPPTADIQKNDISTLVSVLYKF
jgi:putative salt-induced outer membrane protein YdiY